MKRVEFGEEKRDIVLATRNIDLERVKQMIEAGQVVKSLPNPNYPHQHILLIEYDTYPCLVPVVEDEEKIFIKTAYFDRRYKQAL